jgi:hypothetical protein
VREPAPGAQQHFHGGGVCGQAVPEEAVEVSLLQVSATAGAPAVQQPRPDSHWPPRQDMPAAVDTWTATS